MKQSLALVTLIANSALAQSIYTIEQVTTGSANHRAPCLSNSGEILWMEEVPGEGWQVVSSTRSKLTSPDATYSTAQYPALADDGSFVCFRPKFCVGDLLRYPGPSTVEFCSRNGLSHRDPIPQSGISSDGKVIHGREFYDTAGFLSTRRFYINGAQVSPGSLVNWQNPSINHQGEYVYEEFGQIISSRRGGLVTGLDPSINDHGEVAFVSGGEVQVLCRSADIATIVAPGRAPSINDNGVVTFERLVKGTYQIFRATPPRCFTCVKWLTQCASPWGDDPYDGRPVTVCKKGCALTCLTMALNYAGFKIDPGTLNTFMKNTGNFTASGNVDWLPTTEQLSLGNARWRDRRENSQTSPSAASQYLNEVLCNHKYPVVVGVWKLGSTKTFPDHYVLVVGKEGDRYQIADPYFPNLYLDEYPRFETRGYVEPRMAISAGIAPVDMRTSANAVAQLRITVSGNADLWIVAPDGRITGIDPTSGNIVEDIPSSSSFEDGLSDDETGEPPDSSTQFIYINQPKSGRYRVFVTAAETGQYELAVASTYDDGSKGVSYGLHHNIQAGSTNTLWIPVGTSLTIARLRPAEMRLELVTDRTNRFTLEASGTLSNWVTIADASLTNGVFEFVDTNAPSLNQRFYRAVGDP